MSIENNRINFVFSPEQVAKLNEGFSLILDVLEPQHATLTTHERMALPKIDVSNKAFTEDAVDVGTEMPHLLPPYLNVAEARNDLACYQQINPFTLKAERVMELMRDTQMLAGSEAYVFALMLYKFTQNAADNGVEGADAAYQRLKTRFEGQGPQGGDDTPPTPTA